MNGLPLLVIGFPHFGHLIDEQPLFLGFASLVPQAGQTHVADSVTIRVGSLRARYAIHTPSII